MAETYMGMEVAEVAKGAPKENDQLSDKSFASLGNATEAPSEPAQVAEPVSEAPKEAQKAPEPVATPEPSKVADPVIQEKIVEKIVEKYPEFKDDATKQLYEHFVNGEKDAIYKYLTEINKNYDTMSDIDLVREDLAKKNPLWDSKDIDLEIRAEYGKQLEKYDLNDFDKDTDPDGYKEALAHNERADENLLRLQRAARNARTSLKEQQKTIELPKINQPEPAAAVPANAPTPEEIAAAQEAWANAASEQVANFADYKFQVGDDKNPEDVVFAVTPEDKAARIDAMKKWNGQDFMSQRGWTNQDGSFNLLKIAEDVHTLENNAKMVKSAYTQGKVAGKKETISSDIKNRDTEINRQSSVPAQPVDVGELIWG